MSWDDFVGRAFARDEFATYVDGLTWTPEQWNPEHPQLPKGIVLHNTSSPTLKQWVEDGAVHDQRIKNLKSYYENDQHWHGGPHLFVSREYINVFDGLLEHGVHSPSFNPSHFGVEMVGDYDSEPFNTGDGAKVRDNAVFAMAVLCKKFNWNPAKVIVLHKEDPKTTHDCPGKLVNKADVIRRVTAALAEMRGGAGQIPAFLSKSQTGITATVFGYAGDEGQDKTPSAYGGFVDPDKPECALPARIQGERKRVKVTNPSNNESVICEITDVGPWTSKVGMDKYWETGTRPKSESDVRTNGAGIDLTPFAAKAIGLSGKGKVNWEFTNDGVPQKLLEDEVVQDTGVEVEVVQRRLKEMGYHEVGAVDGKWAGKTASAIAGFKNDRHLMGPAIIDQELKDELDVAEQEGFKRPVATERANAPEEVVETKAPELAPVKQNRFVAFWGSVVAAFGALADWLGDRYRDVLGWFSDIREYLGLIPKFVWFMIAAVVLIYFWKNSQKSAAGIVKSFQTGERN